MGKALNKRVEIINSCIITIRGQRVILDRDLARLYGVETRRLNERVKRNIARFPLDFAFQLEHQELTALMSQIATSNTGRGGYRKMPWAFTEHGAIMAANVLRSEEAIEMSVFIVRAFVKMREALLSRNEMEKRLSQIENILLVHDQALKDIYEQIRPLLLPPAVPAVARRAKAGIHRTTNPSASYSVYNGLEVTICDLKLPARSPDHVIWDVVRW